MAKEDSWSDRFWSLFGYPTPSQKHQRAAQMSKMGVKSGLTGEGAEIYQLPKIPEEYRELIGEWFKSQAAKAKQMGKFPGALELWESANKMFPQIFKNLEMPKEAELPPFDFSGEEELARKRFSEETIPSLAERFTGMGEGAQRSSGFQAAIGRSGADLEAQMKAQRGTAERDYALKRALYGLQRAQTGAQLAKSQLSPLDLLLKHGALQQKFGGPNTALLNLLLGGLGYESGYQPAAPSAWSHFAQGAGEGLGKAIPMLFAA